MSDDPTLEPKPPADPGNGGEPSSDPAPAEPSEPSSLQPEPDDSLEQKERSRLGRRFTKFEQEMEGLKQSVTQLMGTIRERQAIETPVDDKPPVEYITTPEDLEKYESWKQDKEVRRRNVYANNYIHSIKSMNYLNPDLHDEIENELLTNVNEYPTYSKFSDPASDARQNYLKAENKLLKQRMANLGPRPNVKGGNTPPSGVSSSSRVNAPPKNMVKLDEYASKFVKSIGETEDAEWVQNSIARGDK